jgi:hypothetical protein
MPVVDQFLKFVATLLNEDATLPAFSPGVGEATENMAPEYKQNFMCPTPSTIPRS